MSEPLESRNENLVWSEPRRSSGALLSPAGVFCAVGTLSPTGPSCVRASSPSSSTPAPPGVPYRDVRLSRRCSTANDASAGRRASATLTDTRRVSDGRRSTCSLCRTCLRLTEWCGWTGAHSSALRVSSSNLSTDCVRGTPLREIWRHDNLLVSLLLTREHVFTASRFAWCRP
ncbi:hypothetical protein MTO96_015444 [Rhipicephalus appendiculatus]